MNKAAAIILLLLVSVAITAFADKTFSVAEIDRDRIHAAASNALAFQHYHY